MIKRRTALILLLLASPHLILAQEDNAKKSDDIPDAENHAVLEQPAELISDDITENLEENASDAAEKSGEKADDADKHETQKKNPEKEADSSESKAEKSGESEKNPQDDVKDDASGSKNHADGEAAQNDKKTKKTSAGKTKQSAKTSGKKSDSAEKSEEDNQEKLAGNPQRKIISLASEEILARPDVEKFRRQYLSPKWAEALRGYLESAMEYRLYVRKAVQDAGVPEVLEYLPVVESNYKTNAKSKSGALGMWQFMANSVAPFLTLNDYVDERLDPWKSTDAAIKKLQDNYNVLGDWLLAIAAYNCGLGALRRAVQKAGSDKDFWYLADNNLLPAQTISYIPKLLAIADLAINSEYYGIDLPSHDEEFEILENEKNGNFDYITVQKAYSINQLAQEMRMDTATLKHLNPSYVMGMTQPAKPSQIRLPLGMKQSAIDALAQLQPIEFPMKYTVVSGDSLWSISRRYNTTVQALCDLNNIDENAVLKIGKILYIPAK